MEMALSSLDTFSKYKILREARIIIVVAKNKEEKNNTQSACRYVIIWT